MSPPFAVARLEGAIAWIVDATDAVEFGLEEAWEGYAGGVEREGEHGFDHDFKVLSFQRSSKYSTNVRDCGGVQRYMIS